MNLKDPFAADPVLRVQPPADVFEMMKALADAYPAAYQTLYEAKPVTCSVTGTTFDAIPAPCAVVLDVSQSTDMLHVTESTVMPAHDCSFMFLLLVLCLSSIACY